MNTYSLLTMAEQTFGESHKINKFLGFNHALVTVNIQQGLRAGSWLRIMKLDDPDLQTVEELQLKSTMACGNGKYVVDANGDKAIVYQMEAPYEKMQTYQSSTRKISLLLFLEDIGVFGISDTRNAADIRLYDSEVY